MHQTDKGDGNVTMYYDGPLVVGGPNYPELYQDDLA